MLNFFLQIKFLNNLIAFFITDDKDDINNIILSDFYISLYFVNII